MSEAANKFLAHHGVKGMHWGVRKREESAFRTPKVTDKGAPLSSTRKKELTKRANSQSDRMAVNAGADEDEVKKGWSRGRKVLLGVGIGLGVAGLAVGAAYVIKSRNQTAFFQSARAQIVKNKFDRQAKVSDFFTNYMDRASDTLQPIDNLADLDDVDIHIPAGSEFERLTSIKDEPLTTRLYTSFTNADSDRYKAVYADTLQARTGAKQLFVSRLKVKEEIRSPSERKRVQAFIDVVKEHGHELYDDGGGGKSPLRDQLQLLDFDSMFDTDEDGNLPAIDDETLAKRVYHQAQAGMAFKSTLSDLYMDKIRSQGYNALVDDNDYKKLSDLPIILLNPDKVVTSRTQTPLSRKDIFAAQERLTDLINK